MLDLLYHALHRLCLVDEALGAKPDRLGAAVVVPRTRVHDHGRLQAAPRHGAQHFEAVHAGHFEVEDDAIHGLALQRVERRLPAVCDERFVATDALQVVRVLIGHGDHVVDDQNGVHAFTPGSSTMNVLPAPGCVSTRSEPLASRRCRSPTRPSCRGRPGTTKRFATRCESSPRIWVTA